MIWNSDGFRDSAKHFTVQETVREQNLSFVAILETGRSIFSVPFLKQLAGGREFVWYCLPPHGHSRGILVGLNVNDLAVQSMVAGDFCIKLELKKISWTLSHGYWLLFMGLPKII